MKIFLNFREWTTSGTTGTALQPDWTLCVRSCCTHKLGSHHVPSKIDYSSAGEFLSHIWNSAMVYWIYKHCRKSIFSALSETEHYVRSCHRHILCSLLLCVAGTVTKSKAWTDPWIFIHGNTAYKSFSCVWCKITRGYISLCSQAWVWNTNWFIRSMYVNLWSVSVHVGNPVQKTDQTFASVLVDF